MMQKSMKIPGHFTVNNDEQLTFTGMNVLENPAVVSSVAHASDIAHRHGFKLIFKVSWDKANERQRQVIVVFREVRRKPSLPSYRHVTHSLSLPIFMSLSRRKNLRHSSM